MSPLRVVLTVSTYARTAGCIYSGCDAARDEGAGSNANGNDALENAFRNNDYARLAYSSFAPGCDARAWL